MKKIGSFVLSISLFALTAIPLNSLSAGECGPLMGNDAGTKFCCANTNQEDCSAKACKGSSNQE